MPYTVDDDFTVEPASDAGPTIEWVHRILEEERALVISARPLEAEVEAGRDDPRLLLRDPERVLIYGE